MANSEIVRKSVEFIEANIEKDLSVDLIAAQLNYSVRYLSECFRQHTTFTLGYYIDVAKTERAARALMGGLCVSEAAELSGFDKYYKLTHRFGKVYEVPPSHYIGAKDLPVIRIHVPVTVAGYVLRRVEANEDQTGLALWHGYDFSKFDPNDFNVASPEGGAEVGVWAELDGKTSYLFGVCCREDATIPDSMVRCTLPPALYAMFLIPATEDTHELSENIKAALKPALRYCEDAKKYEPIPDMPVLEYYHGKDTFLCVPIRERKE